MRRPFSWLLPRRGWPSSPWRIGWAALAPLPHGARALTFVIPPGAAARLKAGEEVSALPSPIHLTVGVRDVLVLTNDDVVVHQVGPIVLGAGRRTDSLPRDRAAIECACSLHAGGTLALVVDPEPAAGLPAAALAAGSTSPPPS